MSMKTKDQITAIIVFILGTVGYLSCSSIPAESAAFPKIIFIFTIILAVLLFISTIFGLSLKGTGEEGKINYKRIIFLFLLTVLYYLLINPVGYFIVTPIFLFLSSYLLELRKTKILIFYPIGLTLLLYIGFVILLKVPLPIGILLGILR